MLKDLECFVHPPQGFGAILAISGKLVDAEWGAVPFKYHPATETLSLIPGDVAAVELTTDALNALGVFMQSMNDLQRGGVRSHYSFEDCKTVVGHVFDSLGLECVIATDGEAEWSAGRFHPVTLRGLAPGLVGTRADMIIADEIAGTA
ncbi:hypothetical protein [Shinella zoogloeoides]|uniref:hypothetical protein n=1 Tax=Shinella zoogloeoides TaxID=352475 RepID=UPI00273ED700|nr:hypothetical protein [Shinella zoogloeoides]WLR94080.1 hypothetical protein Q9316_07835 [Shinella zoogloeoides]